MTNSFSRFAVWMRWAIQQNGFWGAVRRALGRLRRGRRAPAMVHPFDVDYGVETSGLIDGGELPGGHAHDVFSTAYFGVPPSRLRSVLARWRTTPDVGDVSEYAFLDVGCGKGRALLLASELPFREAVGVELNAGLAEVARRNAGIWKETGRACCPIRVVTGDATEIELPSGSLLIYLYNPFQAQVLQRLVKRLDLSAARGGRRVELLYLYPKEEEVFADFPRFGRVWKERFGLAETDVGVDGISEPEDPCSMYRWIG